MMGRAAGAECMRQGQHETRTHDQVGVVIQAVTLDGYVGTFTVQCTACSESVLPFRRTLVTGASGSRGNIGAFAGCSKS